MRRVWSLLLVSSLGLLASRTIAAQSAPPSTDVWLAPIGGAGRALRVGTPVNVTNRPGYDNQPSFSPDGRYVYFTSVRDSQADIWRYDRTTRAAAQITRTSPESEYSATVMPGGQRFSVIRVERDSTQRLWSFALDGSDPRPVLSDVKPVGYHAWVDDSTLALFVLGNPNSLQIADAHSGGSSVVARDIGRSLVRIPRRNAVSFLQHGAAPDSSWYLTILDLDQHRGDEWPSARLAKMLPGSDYVAWLPDGRALAGAGAKLYELDPKRGTTWREIADLSSAGLSRISRLALSPDGRTLALVAEPK